MILAFIEHDNKAALEILTLGRELAEASGKALEVVLIGENARSSADELGTYGISKVHLVTHERLTDFAPEAWAKSMVQLIESLKPEALIALGNDLGHEVMAHVAAQMDLPLAANCTQVQYGDTYQLTRVQWGGSLFEEASLSADIKLLTVAPHTFEVPDESVTDVETTEFSPELDDKLFRVQLKERVEPTQDKISLSDAHVVIGGGRGVGSAEGFEALENLADILNAAVGASRVVTNLGWRSHSDQIGQTGTRIAPDLYIACGVSGAVQHMVGCKGTKTILAINTDEQAPIMLRADYAVIGDLHEVLPALTEQLKSK